MPNPNDWFSSDILLGFCTHTDSTDTKIHKWTRAIKMYPIDGYDGGFFVYLIKFTLFVYLASGFCGCCALLLLHIYFVVVDCCCFCCCSVINWQTALSVFFDFIFLAVVWAWSSCGVLSEWNRDRRRRQSPRQRRISSSKACFSNQAASLYFTWKIS